MVYIGIDLGGTKTIVASANKNGKIIKKIEKKTPFNFNGGMKMIKDMVRETASGNRIISIGCACGGPLDYKRGIVSPLHQPEWNNIHLKKIMEKEFNCPFYVDVDTNIAAIGELFFGEGRNYKKFIYITISTGFGAGIVINKEIYRGYNDLHPELGHQEIDSNKDIVCKCGALNCLEGVVSGYAIEKQYKKPANYLSDSEWREVGINLGKGLRNIIIMYAPELILLSGGVAINANPIMLKFAISYVKDNVKLLDIPKIRISKLGHEAPLMGAIATAIKLC